MFTLTTMGLVRARALLQLFYKCMISGLRKLKMIVGVMMVDLSAAFDMVDHPLFLEKLRVFGLEENFLAVFLAP